MTDWIEIGCDEAGAALLGSALHGNDAARAAITELTVDDLTDTRQRVVLAAMLDVIGQERPLDPVTVLASMRSGALDVRMPAGRDCAVFIADLMEQASAIDPAYMLEAVRQHALRRMVRAFGERTAQAAGSSSLQDMVTQLRDDAIRVIAAAKKIGIKP